MKKFIQEFKEFIARGNVLDMAVGVIIATAFGAITTALVSKVITPLLAFLFNAPNTDALNITLRAAELAADGTVVKEAIVLGLGDLLGAIVNFIVIAFIVFCIIKAFNKAKTLAEKKKAEEPAPEPEPEPEPEPTKEELLLTEIRDLLKKQSK